VTLVHRIRLAAVMTVAAALLDGCASLMPPSEGGAENAEWTKRQSRLSAIERWTVQGRVAIETAAEGATATINWNQDGESYSMRIVAPLGQGTFELQGNAEAVSLRAPDNKTLTARDPQALMQQSLGWSLPLAGLKYWVRGLPQPDHPVEQLRLDEAGRVLDMEQDGWRISLLRYSDVNGIELPEKIFMASDPLKMRLVISEWKLP
jgi:outer membrane lipoprotein LolB